MYFITKTRLEDGNVSILGAASIKGAAWSKMREAIIADLLDRDGIDPFAHDISTILPPDGGEFYYDGVEARIDSLSGSSAFVEWEGDVTKYNILTFPEEKLMTPVLSVLAENHEKYGLTGKQKSQVIDLLAKFPKEDY